MAIDPDPGIPRPARGCLLAPVQHRVPGSLPRRHELPGLPQPRRRRAVRGGVHPVARAEPGRRDVLVRVLGALRAGVPPRRHRPAARDPRDEAVPRGVARGLGDPRRHAPDHAACRARRGGRRRPGRPRRRARARDQGLPVHRLRQPAVRRRHDARRRPGLPAAARGDRDGRAPGRAAGREVRVRHHHRHRHHVRRAPARLRRDRDHGRRDEPGLPRRPGRRPRRRPVRRRLHEEGQPRPGDDGRAQRRRHRRRLHGHGLLAHEPALRRRERDHRLPPHPLRAGRGRRGAGRDRARGRSAWSSSSARSS